MQVKEREANGASTLDSAASVSLRVVTWMPLALRLHPLGDPEFVAELKHDLLLFGKKSGSRCSDSRCGLGCSLLLSRLLLRCGLLSGFDRRGYPRFLAVCLLGL